MLYFCFFIMVKLVKLKDKIRYRIKKSKDTVFLLKDFDDITDRNQAGRILRELIKDGLLMKIGYGLYSKCKKSEISERTIPEKGLIEAGKEALKKLGIKTYPTTYETWYNNFLSTQVPTGRVLGVKSRITRKIAEGSYSLKYERL